MKAVRPPSIDETTARKHSGAAKIARSEPVIPRAATSEEISEEKLFSELVDREMKRVVSSENYTKFQALVEKQIRVRTNDSGSVNWEKVGKGALRWAKRQGVIGEDDAEGLYSRAFQAAQLDSNSDELWDEFGTSAAVLNKDDAYARANLALEQLIAGTKTVALRDIAERSDSKGGNVEREGDAVADEFRELKKEYPAGSSGKPLKDLLDWQI